VTALEGPKIGPYRTTGVLGQGGVGIVYSGVREGDPYAREVAIKLIRLGTDSAETRAWFKQEQQALSRLSHPGIAMLLDAGEDGEGTPYLVIEKVAGESFSKYCRARDLSVSQKLDLFLKVCEAVSHAHQNLVIHSDLKPANILVDKDGNPKLLDFGISTWVFGESASAEQRAAALTPAYASPEQIRGEVVNTTTDIYSLGVLLYEMLTGESPYRVQGQSAADLERLVTTAAPRFPSQLRGDMELILRCAMHHDAARRYTSVTQFADDIRAYMRGYPISARPDTIVYRSRKFLARHRLITVTAAAVLITLAIGAAYTTRQAQRAEARFQQVRSMANSFLFDFDARIQNLPGSIEARELVANEALKYLSALHAESVGDVELEWDIGNAYEKVGDVQGHPNTANLGHTTAAIQSYRASLEIKERLIAANKNSVKLRSLATTCFRLGDLLLHSGDSRAAQDSFTKGLQFSAMTGTSSREDLILQGSGQMRLGQIKAFAGDAAGAYETYRKSAEAYRKLAASDRSAEILNLLMVTTFRTAYALVWSGRLDEAMAMFTEASQAGEESLHKSPGNMTYMRDLAITYWSFGDLLGSPFHINLAKPAQAEVYYRKAAELTSRMVALSPKNAQARIADSNVRIRIAHLMRASNPAGALRSYGELIKANDELLASDPQNLEYSRDRGFILFGIGSLLSQTRQFQQSAVYLREALAIQEKNATGDTARTQFRQDMIPTRLSLGETLISLARREEARAEIEAACGLAEAQRVISPHNLYSIRNLSNCYLAKSRLSDADVWMSKDLELWTNWEAAHGANPFTIVRKRGTRQ
jgi:tetratricopeptide (TPR) repeat protein